MAESDYPTAKFVSVNENAFYFEGPQVATEDELDGCIEEDLFQSSPEPPSVKLLRCHDNKFLILSCDGLFEKRDLTLEGQCSSENKFFLQFFNDNDRQNSKKGAPVMLYAVKCDKKLVACCNSSDGISAEEIEIQDIIQESKHKALFYMIRIDGVSKKYIFESSLYENKYLGFGPNDPNLPVVKLVLRMYDPDNHDDELSPE